MVERKRLLCTTLFFLAVACTRNAEKSSLSTLTIQTPNHLVSGVGTLVALPVGRTACYGINVLGAGPSNASTCGPTTGITAGYVPAGGSVTANVPSKQTVSIQLFLYLKALGDTSPCPTFAPVIPATQISDTYLVGESSNLYVDGADMSVTINGTFPGVSQNIAQTLSLPVSCLASSSSGSSNFSISAGAQAMSGAGVSLSARAGKPKKQYLSGGGFTLIVR